MVIESATADDLPAVQALLTGHNLPLDDVTSHGRHAQTDLT